MSKLISMLLATLALASCAGTDPVRDTPPTLSRRADVQPPQRHSVATLAPRQEPTVQKPTLERDEFTGRTTLSLKVIDDPAKIRGGKVTRSTTGYLKQRLDAKNEAPRLLLMVVGGEWLFLSKAVAPGNVQLPTTADRQVRGGTIVELVEVTITPELVTKSRVDGLRLRFYGKQENLDVAVDAPDVQRFLKAVEEQRTAASPPKGK